MEAKGHVFKYGDNVDTDVIIPAAWRYHCCKKEFRMRLIKRARTALSENRRSKLHYCRDVRKDFLPEFYQYRTSDH